MGTHVGARGLMTYSGNHHECDRGWVDKTLPTAHKGKGFLGSTYMCMVNKNAQKKNSERVVKRWKWICGRNYERGGKENFQSLGTME